MIPISDSTKLVLPSTIIDSQSNKEQKWTNTTLSIRISVLDTPIYYNSSSSMTSTSPHSATSVLARIKGAMHVSMQKSYYVPNQLCCYKLNAGYIRPNRIEILGDDGYAGECRSLRVLGLGLSA